MLLKGSDDSRKFENLDKLIENEQMVKVATTCLWFWVKKIFPTSCCLFLSNCVSNKSWENFFFTTRFFEVKTIVNQKLHRTPEIFVGWIRMSLWFFLVFSINIHLNKPILVQKAYKNQRKKFHIFSSKKVSKNNWCRLGFTHTDANFGF